MGRRQVELRGKADRIKLLMKSEISKTIVRVVLAPDMPFDYQLSIPQVNSFNVGQTQRYYETILTFRHTSY